jgi:hypothetical protein
LAFLLVTKLLSGLIEERNIRPYSIQPCAEELYYASSWRIKILIEQREHTVRVTETEKAIPKGPLPFSSIRDVSKQGHMDGKVPAL